MDSGVKDANSTTNCNGGSKPSYCVEESKEEADKAEEEDGDGESKSLLQSAKVANGGLAKKRQKSSRRRVQWNDRNGDKLAEILEYQPRFDLFFFFSFHGKIMFFVSKIENLICGLLKKFWLFRRHFFCIIFVLILC